MVLEAVGGGGQVSQTNTIAPDPRGMEASPTRSKERKGSGLPQAATSLTGGSVSIGGEF